MKRSGWIFTPVFAIARLQCPFIQKVRFFTYLYRCKSIVYIVFVLLLLAVSCDMPEHKQANEYVDHRSHNIDSLEQLLKTNPPEGNELLQVYFSLASGYVETNNEKARFYARYGITLADRLDQPEKSSTLYLYMGNTYYDINRYDSAMIYYENALKAVKQMEKSSGKYTERQTDGRYASIFSAIGNFYNIQGDFHIAMDYYSKALKLFEKHGWTLAAANAYYNIGELYLSMENYDQAEINYNRTHALATEASDSLMMTYAFEGLSKIYLYSNEYAKAEEYAIAAYHYYFLHPEEGINKIAILNILAEIYTKGYGDIGQTEQYARQALQIADTLGLVRERAISMQLLSLACMKRGKWRDAEQIAHEALKADTTEPTNTLLLYEYLAKSYAYLGDAVKTEEYFDKYHKLQSSWSNKHYQSAIREMETKYETEKKEIQITSLQEERLLMIWLGVAGGAILLLALAAFFFLWRWTVQKKRLAESQRKLAEQQVKQLEQEKQLIATQSVLDGEVQERIRLARDLHDGLGSMLTGVKFNLESLKGSVILGGNEVEYFGNAMKILDDSILEMRRVAHHLMPDTLIRYGLKAALKGFCDSFPLIEYAWFGNDERLAERQREIMIYRIIHELVNNALKHSGATKISVSVMREDNYIAFTVYDNGCGFDKDRQTQGMGLQNIRERVVFCNGRMELDTGEGKGTEVNIEFKIENHDKSSDSR